MQAAWVPVAEGLPTTEEFGPYPHVIVALACKGHPEWGCGMRFAQLRFFGGDKTRPYWCSDTKSPDPIENDAWHVVAWTRPPVAFTLENQP